MVNEFLYYNLTAAGRKQLQMRHYDKNTRKTNTNKIAGQRCMNVDTINKTYQALLSLVPTHMWTL